MKPQSVSRIKPAQHARRRPCPWRAPCQASDEPPNAERRGSRLCANNSSHGAAGACTRTDWARPRRYGVGKLRQSCRASRGAKRFRADRFRLPLMAIPGFSTATSSIPWNRVGSTGRPARPADRHCHQHGRTRRRRSAEAEILASWRRVWVQGAGLAGVAEIFSAVMTGMHISPDLMSMDDPDLSTPRQLGAFIIAFDPTAFVTGAVFSAGMEHYLVSLRDSPPRWCQSWRQATNGRKRNGGVRGPSPKPLTPSNTSKAPPESVFKQHRNRLSAQQLSLIAMQTGNHGLIASWSASMARSIFGHRLTCRSLTPEDHMGLTDPDRLFP